MLLHIWSATCKPTKVAWSKSTHRVLCCRLPQRHGTDQSDICAGLVLIRQGIFSQTPCYVRKVPALCVRSLNVLIYSRFPISFNDQLWKETFKNTWLIIDLCIYDFVRISGFLYLFSLLQKNTRVPILYCEKQKEKNLFSDLDYFLMVDGHLINNLIVTCNIFFSPTRWR